MSFGLGRKRGKKGQMEMMGLVIIVILVTLGMLFMAQFALKGEAKKKIFVRKGLAYSTMGALMKTSVDCQLPLGELPYEKALTIGGDLVDDCASYKEEFSSYYKCGERAHSCVFLEGLVKELLEKTLGKWNKHYEFKSKLVSGVTPKVLIEVKDKGGKGCPGERDSSGLFPVNTEAGLVETVLYLCD